MKKLCFYLCLLGLFSCAGYEPIFSVKKINFYIEDIIITNGDNISKKVSKNLNINRLKKDNKKNYILKISSNKRSEIRSKDKKGNALTFEMIVDVQVEVFQNNIDLSTHTLKFTNNFSYNNQQNKFDLNQYKKIIEENMITKISQDIVVKLQTL